MGTKLKSAFKSEYFRAFVLAVLFSLTGFALAGAWPFGKYSAACSDMRLQYLEITSGLFNIIKKGIFPFAAYQGLGVNLYAAAANIIFDPLNIIFLFFDKTLYSDIYLFITLIKYGLIALCSSIYLKKSRYVGLGGIQNVALSVMYAFGGFCIKCAINVMWLEAVALLPILLLGIENIIEKRRFGLLFFCYAYFLLTDYYLGYMAGVFAALYFVFYYLVQKGKFTVREVSVSFFICLAAVVLAAGCAAISMLPSFKNVSSGYSNMFSDSFFSRLIGWDAKKTASSFLSLQKTGASASVIYGFYGIAVLYIPLVFIFDRSVPLKERIAVFAFILFMILSLLLRPLYLMWHMFRSPTGFYGRFVFTTGFLLVMLSARYLSKYRAAGKAVFYLPALLLTALSFYANNAGDAWQRGNALIITLFVFIYAVLFSYAANGLLKKASAVLMLCESFIMCTAGIYVLKSFDQWYERDYRIKYINDTEMLMSEINDDGFYRMTDVSSTNTNLPFGIGYNSLETFSSQTNQKSLEKLSQLGIWCPYDYRACANYFNNTVSEGLFDVKYVMATDSGETAETKNGKYIHTLSDKTTALRLVSDNYRLIAKNAGGYIYENTHAFPLMFAAEESAIDADKAFYRKEDTLSGSYKNQATFLNALFGRDYKLYDEYMPEGMTPMNAKITGDPKGEWSNFTLELTNLPKGQNEAEYDISQLGFMGYTLTADKKGEYFIDARYNYKESDVVYQKIVYAVNGTPLLCLYNSASQLLTNDIGQFEAGEKINIQLQLQRTCTLQRPLILRLRQEEYDDFYNTAQKNALLNIREENGHISAKSDFGKDRLIFSSLSYDNGFHVYIDGKETEKVKIADAFLGFRVPAGRHDIEVKYISPGFKTGAVISLLSLSLGIALCLYGKAKRPTDAKRGGVALSSTLWQKTGFLPISRLVCVHQRYTCKSVEYADFVCSSAKTRFPPAD